MTDSAIIDLTLYCNFPRLDEDFDTGADRFLALLRTIESSHFFQVERWISNSVDVWDQKQEFLENARSRNREEIEKKQLLGIGAGGSLGGEPLLKLHYIWRSKTRDSLSIEYYRSHPNLGTPTQMYVDMVDIITAWRRPKHLRCQPFLYLRDYHPFDRARSGIGWIGWIPFDLSPSDVPEAHRVESMNGGTLIVSQPHFWQAGGPNKDDDAIARAQEVDMKLNLLGVLPTIVELERGDWGQP